jgi:hypothetical protein
MPNLNDTITEVSDLTLLRSMREDRDRQMGMRDAQWMQCKAARRRLVMALACDPTKDAGMRDVHLKAALAALGDLGAS